MSMLRRKSVLVLGATGFIGRSLVKRLVKDKASVRVLVRKREDKQGFESIKVRIFVGDLLDFESLLKAMTGVEIVFNAAGVLPHHRVVEEEYWNTNVEGIKNILRAAVKKKVKRVVHLSTVGIYGETAECADEKTPTAPVGVYAKSKLAGEQIVIQNNGKRISTVVIRPTIAYGPGDMRPVILSLCRLIRKGFFVPIGSGMNYFHTVYIDNLVEAIILAAIKKGIGGESFIIGDEPCPRTKELWSSIAKKLDKKIVSFYIPVWVAILLSRPVLMVSKKVNFFVKDKRYEIAKAKRILGYKPRVSLKEGIARTIDWYNERNLL